MPITTNNQNSIENINRLLDNSSNKIVFNFNGEANKWLQNDPNFIGNLGKVLLTDFYINYKTELNENIENLSPDIREDCKLAFTDVMLKNENEFLNSFTNIMITSPQKLEFLTSAVETSKVLVESTKEMSGIMSKIESLLDASKHLFNRLNVYHLMPIWGASIRVSEDELVQRWNNQAWDNFEENQHQIGHGTHLNEWLEVR